MDRFRTAISKVQKLLGFLGYERRSAIKVKSKLTILLLQYSLTERCTKQMLGVHTSDHSPIFHSGHCPRLQIVLLAGLVAASQLVAFPLHTTARSLTPSPQVAEH